MNLAFLYFIPISVFVVLLVVWLRIGQDPRKSKNIPFRYAAPKGLTPAEAGTIVDEHADNRDILATLVELAVRKHFTIFDEGEDLRFRLIQDYEDDPGLGTHEKALLKAIFGRNEEIQFSQIKDDFEKSIPFIKEELYRAVTKKGFFEKNPEKSRARFSGLGILLAGIAFLLFIFGVRLNNVSMNSWLDILAMTRPFYHAFNSTALSALIVFCFSQIMPKKTKKGLEVYEYLLGLEKFLKKPVDKPSGYADERTNFEKLLPYAIVFDAVEPWIEAHAMIYATEQPSFWKSQAKLSAALFAERLKIIGL